VITELLAEQAGVDPRDPEPRVAAHALAGLLSVHVDSRVRWIEEGLSGREGHDRALADVHRAARLIDGGLWAFNSLVSGSRPPGRAQLADAARAAAEVGRQVVDGLRQARDAWNALRADERDRRPEDRDAADDRG